MFVYFAESLTKLEPGVVGHGIAHLHAQARLHPLLQAGTHADEVDGADYAVPVCRGVTAGDPEPEAASTAGRWWGTGGAGLGAGVSGLKAGRAGSTGLGPKSITIRTDCGAGTSSA